MGFIQNFRKLINLMKIYAYNFILRGEQIKIWKKEKRKGIFCTRKTLNRLMKTQSDGASLDKRLGGSGAGGRESHNQMNLSISECK